MQSALGEMAQEAVLEFLGRIIDGVEGVLAVVSEALGVIF